MIRESQPPQRDEKKCETSAARIVIPSGALDLHCAAENSTQAFF